MLCSDCDEEKDGVDGDGVGGAGRQERGSEREKVRRKKEKSSQCTKKRERKANEK